MEIENDLPEVTYYPKVTKPNQTAKVKIDKVFNAIRTGGDYLEIITQIRELVKEENTPTNRSKIDKLKKTLPGISFCGVFNKRSNDALVESSGLACLDFDDTLEVPDGLQKFVCAKFLSPSSSGIKIIIKIPQVKDDKSYKEYFLALEEKFPTIDGSGKDISRLTYMSYDPDIYINGESPTWTEKCTELKQTSAALSTKVHTHQQSNYAKFTIALKMIQQAPIGNRHESILKAGRLMGGYIAGGEVKEEDVLNTFESAVQDRMDHPSDFKAQWDTFKTGIKYGKDLPLKERERERKAVKAEFKAEDVYGDIYYTANDVSDTLDDLYANGFTKGVSTGWSKFDNYYTVLLGYFTILYGAPYTGKSAWLFALQVNLSKLHGYVHAIISPETGSARDVYTKLIQIYAGKDLTKTFNNQMSNEVFQEAKAWVNKHFIVIDYEDTGADLSLEELFLYIQILERKLNVKIHTVTCDPLIEFKFDEAVRDDTFWNRQLRIVRVQAKQNSWHIFLVNHIIKQNRIGIDDYGDSIYPIPDPTQMNGGQTFYRKGFQILGFYRHIFDKDLTLSMTLKALGNKLVFWNSLFVRVQKSKPEGVGRIGEIEFSYDPATHQYRDPEGGRFINPKPIEVEPFRQPYVDTPEWDN